MVVVVPLPAIIVVMRDVEEEKADDVHVAHDNIKKMATIFIGSSSSIILRLPSMRCNGSI